MKFLHKYFPHILLGVLVCGMIWSGINPVDRHTWWAEILPVMMALVVFAGTFKKFRFSNSAYFLTSIALFLQTIGSHYTFAEVPFEWFSDLFGFTRNHYDRVGHFTAGFLAFPITELVQRTKYITQKSAIYLFGLLSLISFAAVYELIEWGYANYFGGKQASDFLGSQGDMWDAQKDILMDTLGAIFSLSIFSFMNKKELA